MDLLKPSVVATVTVKQQQQKVNHDANCKLREFDVDDTVYIQNFRGTPLWIPGIIDKSRGPVSYSVKLTNGTIVKQHVDYVRRRQSRDDIVEPEDDFFYISLVLTLKLFL